MINYESCRLHRRTLLTGILGASATMACDPRSRQRARPIQGGQATTAAAVEQNTTKRRGVGLRALDPERASAGFTLFSPLVFGEGRVYLVDLHGTVVHTWNMPYPPGLSGYLTERGTLFYNGRTSEDSFLTRFPFKGGVVLEADWNGKVLWEVRHPDHHHHGILLRNGNVLLNCMGRVPDDIARRVTGGVEEDQFPSGQYAPRSQAETGKMYSDYLAEVTPTGQTVWEWRTWEHLDPVADGISEIQAPRTLWAQGNSVLELPDGDILTSYRPTSTVLRISRQTGKILWKLGPPTVAGQHAPTLLGNGNILIFDNGVHRLDDSMPFSRVIEVNPATNQIVWKYQDKPAWNFFSPRMGNAQRLPNGNTLVCESSFGRFFEITKDGEIVWEYVNPFFGKPFFAGPPTTEGNLVFRALRYSAEEITRAKATARA
jgi:Arylsulfotransferase (ASST)